MSAFSEVSASVDVADVVQHAGRRWPVVDGIPFLRAGREELADRALALLQAGDERGALVELLGDQDDWWPWPLPDRGQRARAIQAPTLRDAMDALGYGPVGDYFAYRWSDPTFLSGLCLLEHHAGGTRSVFELGCGIGHFLRELSGRGITVAGADVVFSKLWLARRFLVPDARLVCFDAAGRFPVADDTFDVAFCHDVVHYLPDKPRAVAELRRIARRVLVGHAHNRLVDNLSPGQGLSPDDYGALLPGAAIYDDRELGLAAVEQRPPRSGCDHLHEAAAVALAWPRSRTPPLGLLAPRPHAQLALNPLLDPQSRHVRWPSERYRAEYEPLSDYLVTDSGDAGVDELYRRRILVDLPARW